MIVSNSTNRNIKYISPNQADSLKVFPCLYSIAVVYTRKKLNVQLTMPHASCTCLNRDNCPQKWDVSTTRPTVEEFKKFVCFYECVHSCNSSEQLSQQYTGHLNMIQKVFSIIDCLTRCFRSVNFHNKQVQLCCFLCFHACSLNIQTCNGKERPYTVTG